MAALETALHYEQPDEIRGRRACAARGEGVEVYAVVDHGIGFAQRSIDSIPPIAREVALVHDLVRQPAADDRQLEIQAFRTQKVLPAGPLQTVQPIHAVQALNNADVVAFGIDQVIYFARGADHQDSLRARFARVVMGADAQGGKAADQLGLK